MAQNSGVAVIFSLTKKDQCFLSDMALKKERRYHILQIKSNKIQKDGHQLLSEEEEKTNVQQSLNNTNNVPHMLE